MLDVLVDIGDPHRAIAEYVRRAFPGNATDGGKLVWIELSKGNHLRAKVREVVDLSGIDCEARAEALRAFQEVFGNGLPRRTEPDRLATDVVDSGSCDPAKNANSKSKSRRDQLAAPPKIDISCATTNFCPQLTGIAARPQNVPSSAKSTVVTVEERKAIFTALDKAGEPLGALLLYVKVKSIMSEQRLKQVLTALLNEGCVKRLETNNGPRYSRG